MAIQSFYGNTNYNLPPGAVPVQGNMVGPGGYFLNGQLYSEKGIPVGSGTVFNRPAATSTSAGTGTLPSSTPPVQNQAGATPTVANVNTSPFSYGTNTQGNTVADIIASFKEELKAAKEANLARYEEVKGRKQQREADLIKAYDDRYDKALKMLEGAGEQESLDIINFWEGEKAKGMQDLVSQGLSGTTIAPTMKMGYGTQQVADLARLKERLRQDKLNLHSQLSGQSLAAQQSLGQDLDTFIEQREDQYPDLSLLLQMMQAKGEIQPFYGQSQAASGTPAINNAPAAPSGTVTANYGSQVPYIPPTNQQSSQPTVTRIKQPVSKPLPYTGVSNYQGPSYLVRNPTTSFYGRKAA